MVLSHTFYSSRCKHYSVYNPGNLG